MKTSKCLRFSIETSTRPFVAFDTGGGATVQEIDRLTLQVPVKMGSLPHMFSIV